MPDRCAAKIFSLIPHTGNTFPRSVISPVNANDFLIFRLVTKEDSALKIAIPAEGPSFGIAH